MQVTELLKMMNESGKFNGGLCSMRIHSDYSGDFVDMNDNIIEEFVSKRELQEAMNRIEAKCKSDVPDVDIRL